MSKPKTSKPESSVTKPQPLPPFDKLYWQRLGFAALAGPLDGALVGTDYASGISLGIAMYLISYYLARFTWYKGLGKEAMGKVYTTGIGSFILVFLFTWLLFFTLLQVGYSL